MRLSVKRNFIIQQGFDEPTRHTCAPRYSALLFQPRVVAVVVVAGVLLQSPAVFLALSAVLWWSALLPRWNPFDALYNATFAARPGALRLTPAPAPRRFAQGMAASFAVAIAALLLVGWRVAALVLQGLLVAAVAALAFGAFCLGSFVYHLIRGRSAFALKTAPWAAGER